MMCMLLSGVRVPGKVEDICSTGCSNSHFTTICSSITILCYTVQEFRDRDHYLVAVACNLNMVKKYYNADFEQAAYTE